MEDKNEKGAYPNFDKMYDEIAQSGFPNVKSFSNGTEYMYAIKPIPDEFIEIILKWLPKLEYKVGAIDFLREAKNKYDGRILIPIFNEADEQGKWRICDAILHNPPLHINEWVKKTYLDRHYGYSETGLLPLAIAKMFPKNEARAILKQGFDHHYRVTPEALGKVGNADDIPFLEQKLLLDYDATHVRKDIEKAIRKIKKREKI